jgi:Tol biopolymer transport system component
MTNNIISSTKTGISASGTSGQPALSSTGQFVAFASDSLDLSPLVFGLSVIYLKNTTTGDLTLVSSASPTSRASIGTLANANSTDPSISGDGRYVVFQSAADNLVPVGTNGVLVNNKNVSTMASDIFLKDTQTGTTTLVSGSTIGNGESLNAQISTDGQFVAFQSLASNFIGNDDLNGTYDIYLKHLNDTDAPKLVSSDKNGVQGNHASYEPSLSADGLVIAFSSDADNFLGSTVVSLANWKGEIGKTVTAYAPIDDNMSRDVFVRNLNDGTLKLASIDTHGGSANGVSDSPSLSANGNKVAFRSTATDLVEVDNFQSNNLLNSAGIYVNDLSAKTVTLVNAVTDKNGFYYPGGYADGESWNPVISPDGNYVAFISDATNLALTAGFLNNYVADVFFKDLRNNHITRIADIDGARGDAVDFAFSGDSLSLAVTRLISSDYAMSGLTQVYTAVLETVASSTIVTTSGTSTGNRLTGSASNDILMGYAGNDILSGGLNDDLLDGGQGKDKLTGGKGVDELTGGAGNDTFVFKKGDNAAYTDHADNITDLSIGDKIDLSSISKSFNFIHTIATNTSGSDQQDVYVANVAGDNYLVYETKANDHSSYELVAIGSVIPGTLENWTMSAGILTIA